jgi:hypothetical protein
MQFCFLSIKGVVGVDVSEMTKEKLHAENFLRLQKGTKMEWFEAEFNRRGM